MKQRFEVIHRCYRSMPFSFFRCLLPIAAKIGSVSCDNNGKPNRMFAGSWLTLYAVVASDGNVEGEDGPPVFVYDDIGWLIVSTVGDVGRRRDSHVADESDLMSTVLIV